MAAWTEIMFDNFTPELTREAVLLVDGKSRLNPPEA